MKKINLLLLCGLVFLSLNAYSSPCTIKVHNLIRDRQYLKQAKSAEYQSAKQRAKEEGASEETIGKIEHLRSISTESNILMGAMELGNLEIAGKMVKISIGGEAVVVNDFMKLLPGYLNANFRKSKLSLILPEFGGLDLPQPKRIIKKTIHMGDHQEDVFIKEYEIILKNADGSSAGSANVAFVQNHAFMRYHFSKVYEADSSAPPLPGGENAKSDFYNQAYSLGVFNKAINEYYWELGSNIYIPHDYQAMLAARYMGPDPSVVPIIHNGGYHGDLWAHGYGGVGTHRDYSEKYRYGIPTGDSEGMDKIRRILGFSWDEYMHLVEQDGSFNLLKLTQTWVEPHNGITKTVSEGYQEELLLSRDDIFKLIHEQKGFGAKDGNQVYVFNNGVDLGPIKGTDNGLSMSNHASQNPLVSAKDQIKDPFVRYRVEELKSQNPKLGNKIEQYFLRGIDFGDELNSVAGKQKVIEAKAAMKESLQAILGLEVNPNKPIFTVFSRIVDQKNLTPFIENAKSIIDQGGQVVIGGPIGDSAGAESIRRLKEIIGQLNDSQKKQIKVISGDLLSPDGEKLINDGRVMDELKLMMMTGGDFFFITSKFEPCGLTDIESAWMGSFILARETGGLGKIESGMYYRWWDSSDFEGEILEARKLISQAIDLYKNSKDEFFDRIIKGMQQDFNWNDRFDILSAEIKFTAFKKIMNALESDIHHDRINSDQAKSILDEILMTLTSKELDEFYKIVLIREQYFLRSGIGLGILERYFLRYYRASVIPSNAVSTSTYTKFGVQLSGKRSTFRLYAPNNQKVELLLDDRNWTPIPMQEVEPGVFETSLHNLPQGVKYKYQLTDQSGNVSQRIDPYARYVRQGADIDDPISADGKPWHAVAIPAQKYAWKEKNFIPSEYEDILQVFPSTLFSGNEFPNWKDVAQHLVKNYKDTHNSILLEQAFHHNLHASMGFLPGAMFSPNYRFGTPEDLKWAIDYLHQNGFSVKLDFPFHPSKDWDTGLAGIAGGDELYLNNKSHPNWGSRYFDYAKPETRAFLTSWVRYWIEEYNIDGMRVDALASIMRKNFGDSDDWDQHDIFNEEAMEFFRELRGEIQAWRPTFQVLAEDSHYTPHRHLPIQQGGLGIDQKYEMGGMNAMRKELNKNPDDRDIYRFYDSLVTFYHDDVERPHMRLLHYLDSHDEAAFRGYDSEYPGVYFLEGIRDFGDDVARVEYSRMLNAHLRFSMPGSNISMVGNEFANVGVKKGGEVVGRSWNLSTPPNFELLNDPKRQKHLESIKAMHALKENHLALQTTHIQDAVMLKGDLDHQVGVVARFDNIQNPNQNETILAVMNISNHSHHRYAIPLPENHGQKDWQVIFSTDDPLFGGHGREIKVIGIENGELILSELPPRTYLLIK